MRETRGQFIAVLRTPAFVLPTLLFPAMFYICFGLHVAVLCGFTILFLAVAAAGWRRFEES